MSRPTEAAYDAAMQILHGPFAFFSNDLPKPTAIEVALVIDKHTLLPEKHAALLLAQAVVDSWWDTNEHDGGTVVGTEVLEDLQEALTRIKNPPSSARVQKDSLEECRSKPPEAGQEQAGSPL